MSFFPDIVLPDVFALNAQMLKARGVNLLLLDLDNTLSTYSEHLPSEKILSWMQGLKQEGIDLYILSNNRSPQRVERYAEVCEIPYVARAKKPNPAAIFRIMEALDRKPEETALMGDQIFTDGRAAKRAGILAIVVRPIRMGNIFFLARYGIELPFRRRGKKAGIEAQRKVEQ